MDAPSQEEDPVDGRTCDLVVHGPDNATHRLPEREQRRQAEARGQHERAALDRPGHDPGPPALEGAPYNITCNSISPSWVDTPMMAQSLGQQAKARGLDVASLYDEARRDSPQSRIISADEIARQITWLALEAPLALTGEDILMTGGASW